MSRDEFDLSNNDAFDDIYDNGDRRKCDKDDTEHGIRTRAASR